MPGIFISYRRKDTGGYAGRLHDDLVRRYGRKAVFMDIDSLHGGQRFRERIHEALDSSDIALVLIGEAWAASSTPPGGGTAKRRIDEEGDLVRREVAAALQHEDVTVVPVLVEGAGVPDAADLPEGLTSLPDLQVCQLRNSEWRADVRRIRRVIDAADPRGWLPRTWGKARTALSGRSAVGLGLGLVAIAAVAAVLALEVGSDGPTCHNLNIPPDSRSQLSTAAGQSAQAVEKSVYYGVCGSRSYALATFPDGSEDIFERSSSDSDWVDLGPSVAGKCENVPGELLDAWGENDC